MPLEIARLHLASLRGVDGLEWPVHGFVVTHPGGAVLVDTGVGGPQEVLDDWRVVNRSVADALAGLDMSPADIGLVINTHLHFDHCGQNAVFKHAACYVQRAELDRAQRESPDLCGWFDFMNARWELLDGDTEVLPKVESMAPRPKSPYAVQKLVGDYYGAIVLLKQAVEFEPPRIAIDDQELADADLLVLDADEPALLRPLGRADVRDQVVDAGDRGREPAEIERHASKRCRRRRFGARATCSRTPSAPACLRTRAEPPGGSALPAPSPPGRDRRRRSPSRVDRRAT